VDRRGGPPFRPSGRASFTFKLRPPTSFPIEGGMAAAASASLGSRKSETAAPGFPGHCHVPRGDLPKVQKLAQFGFPNLEAHIAHKITLHLDSLYSSKPTTQDFVKGAASQMLQTLA